MGPVKKWGVRGGGRERGEGMEGKQGRCELKMKGRGERGKANKMEKREGEGTEMCDRGGVGEMEEKVEKERWTEKTTECVCVWVRETARECETKGKKRQATPFISPCFRLPAPGTSLPKGCD